MNKPVKGEKYRHFKGTIITIIDIAKHSETLEELVIYEHDGEIWARPIGMFLEPVDKEKYPEVVQKNRFEKIEENL